MAFGFFRRRQKMVLIIMAILMVSFLIGFQGFEMIFQKDRDPLVGQVGDRQIKVSDLAAANSDLSALRTLGLGGSEDFTVLMSQGKDSDRPLTYSLLLMEAEQSGAQVGQAEVDALVQELVKVHGDKDADSFYARMHDNNLKQRTVRGAISNWLLIRKNYLANQVAVPPSQPQLKHVFRDITEQINLQVVKVDASEFMAGAPAPDDAQISQLFSEHRTVAAGTYTKSNPFGFGYRQPDKAQVQYLLLRQGLLERISTPSEDQIGKYYIANQERYRKLGKQPSEVRQEIIAALVPSAVNARTESVMAQAEAVESELLRQYDADKINIFAEVRSQMIVPAENVLNTQLTNVNLEGELQQVVQNLAKLADLDAICFPWGLDGDVKIDPKVPVKLQVNEITLGQALQQITDKVLGPQAKSSVLPASGPSKAPSIVWVQCRGIDRVLFPLAPGEIEMFPLQAGTTGLVSQQEMSSDMVIGNASTNEQGGGTRLLQFVFTAKPFTEGGEGSGMAVGEVGTRMHTMNMDGPAILLWRLANAAKSYNPSPEELQANAELRAMVTVDFKTTKAFDQAVEKARTIMAAAQGKGLEAVTKDQKLTAKPTEPFARKTLRFPREEFMQQVFQMAQMELYRRAMQTGQQPTEQERMEIFQEAQRRFAPQAMLQQPMAIVWSNVPGVDTGKVQNPEMVQQLIESLFALAPKNVEPPYTGPAAMGTAQFHPTREVLVVERIDFKPAVISEFNQTQGLAPMMIRNERWMFQVMWFNHDLVAQRTGFTKAVSEKG